MSEQNPDLVATQAQLGGVLEALRDSIATQTDADALHAISVEIVEVNHRLTVLGQLIFHAKTQAISDAAGKVAAETAKVTAAIAKIDQLNAFLGAISGFLGLVDKVIDLAKLV